MTMYTFLDGQVEGYHNPEKVRSVNNPSTVAYMAYSNWGNTGQNGAAFTYTTGITSFEVIPVTFTLQPNLVFQRQDRLHR